MLRKNTDRVRHVTQTLPVSSCPARVTRDEFVFDAVRNNAPEHFRFSAAGSLSAREVRIV
ncbi:MAG: hypothetical protein ACYDDO_01460 [Acidiferrobacterales bacterium]